MKENVPAAVQQWASPANINALMADVSKHYGSEAYLEYLDEHYRHTQFSYAMIAMANFANQDASSQKRIQDEWQTYIYGGRLGLRAAEQYLTRQHMCRLAIETRSPLPEGDTISARMARTAHINTLGDEGYLMSAPFHAWLGTASLRLARNGREQLALHRGFGLIVQWLDQLIGKDLIGQGIEQIEGCGEEAWDAAIQSELLSS